MLARMAHMVHNLGNPHTRFEGVNVTMKTAIIFHDMATLSNHILCEWLLVRHYFE